MAERDPQSAGGGAVPSGRQRLWQALDRARSGRGAVVELVGESGIGKTRALADLMARARAAGLRVVSGRCAEATPDTAPGLAASVVGGGTASDPSAGPGGRPVSELAAALRRAASPSGLLFVVDDFHWAGDDSVALAEALAQAPIDAPLLVVLALRPRQARAGLLAALTYGRDIGVVERIEVAPLSLDGSARLLGRSADDPRAVELHERAGGNPRYLLALAAPTGEAAASLLAEKAGLGPVEALALQAATVLGEGVDVPTIAAVAELPHEQACAATGVLLRRDLLRPTDQLRRFAFRHPVLRSLYYADLDICWRAAAHRRAAATLITRGAPYTEVAHHVERTPRGPGSDDLAVLAGAAEEAMATDPARAVHWLRVALELAPGPARTDLLLALGRALLAAGRPAESRDVLHDILRTDPPPSWEVRAQALVSGALAECLLGRGREAGTLIGAALAAAPADPPPVLVRLAVVEGVLSGLEGVPPTPGAADLAVRIARARGDRMGEVGALAVRAYGGGDGPPGGEDLDAAGALADSVADAELAADPECLVMLASAESFAGRYREARRHATRGLAALRRSGRRHMRPVLLNTLSNTCRRLGELDAAQQAAAEAARIAGEMGAERLHALALALRSLSLAWMLPPASREPVELAERAVAALPPGSSTWSATAALALAQATALSGDARRAVSVILDVGGGPDLRGVPGVLRPWSYELLAAASVGADLPVSEWAGRAAEAVDRLDMPYLRPYAVSARAYLLRSRGELAEAATFFREAAALFHAAGLACAQASALAEAARCQPTTGEADLTLARELARRCGAGPALGDLEARPSSTAVATHPMLSVLTRRERQIASMAGTGRKTKDISRSLAISPRTVDVHLTRIYRKLNISTRAELARLMATIG
ncbi:helix-turn-helix transcriptional regulator [Micromonospora wenchangensis]|nr:LuxR family transcriptional regulator [Micromonospora wenchangensis]